MTLAEKSDTEILAVADPIMDNLMEGSTAIDHDQHTRDFTERMKRIVTKEYFETVCKAIRLSEGILPEESVWLSSDVHSRWQLCGNNGSRSKQESMWPNWFWWKRSPHI